MSCLSRLFCCFPTQPKQNHTPSTRHASSRATPDGSLEPPTPYCNIYGINGPQWSTSSLPRYTARPVSVYEKTIVLGRGPNPQEDEGRDPRDEKRQQQFNGNSGNNDSEGDDAIARTDQVGNLAQASGNAEDQSSDASSTFSIPSSFGNTSTATRTPPPPPYSSNASSRSPSQRTRSMSLTRPDNAVPVALELQQPQPVLRRGQHRDQWFTWDVDAARRSGGSGRSTPPLPPSYSRT